jgi:uncharacterized protein (DUF1501 family)
MMRQVAGQPSSRRRWCVEVAGLGLSLALPALPARAAARRGVERPGSLVTLWLAGGPSQFETFDPHPGSPVGGPTRAIETAIPGVRIAADYPQVAAVLDRFAVVRSVVSKEGDHERGTHALKTGYRPDPVLTHPALGAVVAHELPAAAIDLPACIALGTGGFPSRGGYLGATLDPYRVPVPGGRGRNLVPLVAADRQGRRLAALEAASRAFAAGRRAAVERTLHDHVRGEALALMESPQLAAFDIATEPQAVRDAYGDTSFGRGCLVARRLVEAGVRSVEVTLSGFDTHADNFAGHTALAATLDPALAALVTDLEQRDLSASTVVVVVGEFGRTPSINPLEGRDHWPNGFTALLSGGGVARGQVVGATDPEGRVRQPTDPVDVADLSATVLAALGIEPTREVETPVGRPMRLAAGRPVSRLLQRGSEPRG